MLGQDPAPRFDYLFEPLNDRGAGEVTGDVNPSPVQSDAAPRRSEAAPNRIVLAAIVLAVTVAAAATVVLLLHQPETSGQVDAPGEPIRLATTETQAPSQPVLVIPPTETDRVNEPPAVTTIVGPQPPEPAPSTAHDEPEVHGQPTTQAPISVEPTSRQPFPKQSPSRNEGQSPSSPSGPPGQAPISVEPTPRQLFPNQSSSGGEGESPGSPSGLPRSPSSSDGNGPGRGPHR
jgi:hypothetical protein